MSPLCVATLRRILLFLACAAFIAGCASLEKGKGPAAVPEVRPGILSGYLQPETRPDSLALIDMGGQKLCRSLLPHMKSTT